MTEASLVRIEIARKVACAHESIQGFTASFVTGSTAEGIADDKSDIDMSLFFTEFPGESVLMEVKDALDPKPPKWVLGSFDEREVAISIEIDGIEVQYGAGTVAQMDGYADKILLGDYGIGPEIKIAIGTLFAIPFHGENLIEGWKERFRGYPESYRTATLEAYLAQRQLNELYPKIAARNAEIWVRRELSERTYAMFAALGALNRVWFSEFQLKRSDAWCAKLNQSPVNLAERARALAELPLELAVPAGITLFDEVRELVSREIQGNPIR